MKRLLVAFDGSWAEDRYLDKDDDTNVGSAAVAWPGDVLYEEGVGSRFGFVGKWLGGLFGIGLHARTEDLIANIVLWKLHNKDGKIYGVGWSRGGVGLVHLANALILQHGIAFTKLYLLDPVPGPFKRAWDLEDPGVEVQAVLSKNPKRFFASLPVQDWANSDCVVVDTTHTEIGRDPQYLTTVGLWA